MPPDNISQSPDEWLTENISQILDEWLTEKMKKQSAKVDFSITPSEIQELGFSNIQEISDKFVDPLPDYNESQLRQFTKLLSMGWSNKIGRPIQIQTINLHEQHFYALQWTLKKIHKHFPHKHKPLAKDLYLDFKNYCEFCGRKINKRTYCTDKNLGYGQKPCYDQAEAYSTKMKGYLRSKKTRTTEEIIGMFKKYFDEIYTFHKQQYLLFSVSPNFESPIKYA